MRIFKTKIFDQWASKIKLSDERLYQAVYEMSLGKFEASLGGYLYKKRVAVGGRGKRGSLRVLLAFKKEDKVFFVYGFAKNKRANIDQKELGIYKDLARIFFSFDDKSLQYALKNRELVEVRADG